MESKGPFRHGLRKADGGYVLFGYIVGAWTGNEVEIECTTNDSVLNSTISEDNVHTIRAVNILASSDLLQRIGLLSQEYAM